MHANQREKSTAIAKGGISKDVHSQIQNLEELVLSLMSRGNHPAPQASSTDGNSLRAPSSTGEEGLTHWQDTAPSSTHTPDPLGPSPEAFGRISIGDKQSSYVGDSHWTAILKNVCTCSFCFHVAANNIRLLV